MIDDEADVDIFENAFRDDVVKVSLHILKQQVHIFVVVCPNGFVQLDYVRVLELLEDFYFSVGTLGIGGVLEGIENLLEGKNPFG